MTGIGNMKQELQSKNHPQNYKIRDKQGQNWKHGTRIKINVTVGIAGYIVDSAEMEKRIGEGEEKGIERQPVA